MRYYPTNVFRHEGIMRGADFAELKALAAIVERASFARAAVDLGMSASALSQTIRQLEARLGVRLLNRTTRSVAPTAAGERLYARLAPTLQELDAAVSETVAGTGRVAGLLRINTPRLAALHLIAPRLANLPPGYPHVGPGLLLHYGLRDIVSGRLHAGHPHRR